MSSARQLTGGTNDVNPQPLNVRLTLEAPTTGDDTVGSIAVPIPVQRLTTGGRAQVLEILKVAYDVNCPVAGALTGGNYAINLSSRSQNVTLPSYGSADPYTILFVRKPFPNGGAGNTLTACDSDIIDLTDGAGHGVLFGMDTLYVQYYCFITGTTPEAPVANFKIWYRWKNVGFTEYVGMVTAQ